MFKYSRLLNHKSLKYENVLVQFLADTKKQKNEI